MVTSHQRNQRSSGATGSPAGPAVVRLDEAVSSGARRVAAALAEPGSTRSRDGWLGVVGDCQALINTLTAVQDAAIAQAARRESIWCEDGTLGETAHAPGRVTLDAADLVAPVIGASHAVAQRRVEQAVRLATGRAPVPADDRDVPEASGLGGLHQAMATGQLDAYRAGVVAFELEVAPADVADAIVAALNRHLGDDAATLRRRTRVLLERISPDLVRERATRARANTGLRRWVAEPGVDEWHGTFPSEDAATAWAAIDKLAHDLVAAGTCTNIEQARGKALTDLVTGNATIDVQVVLTVPATATAGPEPTASGTAADAASPATQVVGQVPTSEAPAGAAGRDDRASAGRAARSKPAVEHVEEVTSRGEAGDDRTTVTDQPHAEPADKPASVSTPAMGALPKTAAESQANGQNDDDLLEVQGARPSEPLLVRRGWLRDHLPKAPPGPRGRKQPRSPFVPCDPLTGARLDPDNHLTTDSYRPGTQLTALVKARDGRCRFPGCSIAARFCDLDHVRPWPTGPTTDTNLLTLCRRHHRIKQAPGWRVHLAPDATTTWTDPTGRERTTTPLDALKTLVLTADTVPDQPHPNPPPQYPPPHRPPRGAHSRPTSSSPSNTTAHTANHSSGYPPPTTAAPTQPTNEPATPDARPRPRSPTHRPSRDPATPEPARTAVDHTPSGAHGAANRPGGRAEVERPRGPGSPAQARPWRARLRASWARN